MAKAWPLVAALAAFFALSAPVQGNGATAMAHSNKSGTNCKTVVKKVHGHKKKVRVCTKRPATPTPQPPKFNGPADIAVSPDGNLIVADQGSKRVLTLSPGGTVIASWSRAGTEPATFEQLYGVALDGEGNIYVSDATGHVVDKLGRDGTPLAQWSTDQAEAGSFPTLLGVASNGDTYVSDHTSKAILHFSGNGTLLGSLGNGTLVDPYGLAVGPDGNLYVTDFAGDRVREFAPSGQNLAAWGNGSNATVALRSPEGIALGPDGTIDVTEQGGRIVRFNRAGTVLGQWGAAGTTFQDPSGIAVDAAGNMYVTEYMANQVDKLAPDGHVLATWR